MKPKGFVLAASITSQTSMPIRSHMSASSFTSPMFTPERVLEELHHLGHARGADGHDRVHDRAVELRHEPGAVRRDAAHDLGNVLGLVRLVPRVDPLGEKARKKSFPTWRPPASIGSTSSSVVPG